MRLNGIPLARSTAFKFRGDLPLRRIKGEFLIKTEAISTPLLFPSFQQVARTV